MSDVHFVVPGEITQLTGGYIYNRRIIEQLEKLGRSVAIYQLPGNFPFVDDIAVDAAGKALAAIQHGIIIIDGLALPAFGKFLGTSAISLPVVVLVHLPLAAETGLNDEQKRQLFESEKRHLALVDRLIVTSPFMAGQLADYQVPKRHIGVVVPGTDHFFGSALSELPCNSHNNLVEENVAKREGVQLLCVANLTPRKGHLLLLKALAEIAELPWYLRCIGNSCRDPVTTKEVRQQIAAHSLQSKVELCGEKSPREVSRAYQQADVFVLASYYESYGMVLTEAMVHGLPIVATRGGAIAEVVPSRAGILVTPGDACGLAQALRTIISDSRLREKLAEGSRWAGRQLPSWEQSARLFDEQLKMLEK